MGGLKKTRTECDGGITSSERALLFGRRGFIQIMTRLNAASPLSEVKAREMSLNWVS